jgi:hypothetical protein
MDKQPRYLSYLLRLWQTSDGARQVWRASLETPGTGERQGFANLKDLFNFINAQAQEPGPWNEQDSHRNTQSE